LCAASWHGGDTILIADTSPLDDSGIVIRTISIAATLRKSILGSLRSTDVSFLEEARVGILQIGSENAVLGRGILQQKLNSF